MQLFLKSPLSFHQVAELIAAKVLRGFDVQERDGLNLGGGNYFLFESGDTEVVLVSNDGDHAEVFVPSRKDFRFYCYVWRGAETILDKMLTALSETGLVGELAGDM